MNTRVIQYCITTLFTQWGGKGFEGIGRTPPLIRHIQQLSLNNNIHVTETHFASNTCVGLLSARNSSITILYNNIHGISLYLLKARFCYSVLNVPMSHARLASFCQLNLIDDYISALIG